MKNQIPCGINGCGLGKANTLCKDCERYLELLGVGRAYSVKIPMDGSWQCPACKTWFGPKSLQMCRCETSTVITK